MSAKKAAPSKRPKTLQEPIKRTGALWERIVGCSFGVVFIAVLLVVHIAFPDPTPTQFDTFKTILALAAAGMGGILAGFLQIEGQIQQIAVRAGGALAIFAIVFFYNPGMPEQEVKAVGASERVTFNCEGDNCTQVETVHGGLSIGKDHQPDEK